MRFRRREVAAPALGSNPYLDDLPAPLAADDPGRGLPGFYIAALVAEQAPAVVRQLAEIPNAQADELVAYVESVAAVYRLAQELVRVDQELSRASNDELCRLLNETHHWEMRSYSSHHFNPTNYSPHEHGLRHSAHGARETEDGNVSETRRRVEQWVEQHVPESQLAAFQSLVARRFELRQAARAGQEGLQRLSTQVQEAHRKSLIIAAAAQLDPTVGIADADQALQAVASAQGALQIVNEALDETYRIAVAAHPELV